MLIIYLFLYVFSLSLPVFYHSAFFVGVLCALQVLLKIKHAPGLTLSRYQFGYFALFIFGYLLISLIVVMHGTYDFSYFKTFTNAFLSALCALPLVRLYQLTYREQCTAVLIQHLYTIFLIQSVIILLVIFRPELKPVVSVFHRNTQHAEDFDIFSNGLRSNALSGALFFGLSLSFSFAMLCKIYSDVAVKKNLTTRGMFSLIIVNIGLMCTGRFGFIYLISLVFLFFSSGMVTRIKTLMRFVVVLASSLLVFALLYHNISIIKDVADNKIYPYFFEIVQVYLDTGTFETASTNDLAYMYDINATTRTWLFGDGRYTGADGLYYQHTDVGYIRLLLLGGIPLLLYIFMFFLYSISPLRTCRSGNRGLYLAIFTLFVIAQGKGEAMITLVSINNMAFLLCSLLSFEKETRCRPSV